MNKMSYKNLKFSTKFKIIMNSFLKFNSSIGMRNNKILKNEVYRSFDILENNYACDFFNFVDHSLFNSLDLVISFKTLRATTKVRRAIEISKDIKNWTSFIVGNVGAMVMIKILQIDGLNSFEVAFNDSEYAFSLLCRIVYFKI